MAKGNKNGMIDGFMSVQAVKRKTDKPLPNHDQEPGDIPPVDLPGKATNEHSFGHTALPPKHHLTCYECGYGFTQSGRLDKVICPKCRTHLATGDKTICGPWSGTIKTVGNVNINQGANISDASITATIITIAGTCDRTRFYPGKHITLCSGAQLSASALSDHPVVIPESEVIQIEETTICRSLKLEGTLTGSFQIQEQAEFGPNAVYRGQLKAQSISITDGAAISAHLHIAGKQQD